MSSFKMFYFKRLGRAQHILPSPKRLFSINERLKKGMRKEFGQDYQSDFLPDLEEQQDQINLENETTLKMGRRSREIIKHNEDYGGTLYKYDLPITNLPIVFRSKNNLATQNDAENTLTYTESLFLELECDKDTAYESFIIKCQQQFNNEVDMYGDVRKAGDVQLRVLEFGTPIPFTFLADEESMKRLRSMFRVNTDIPGALELVHPNKFLASKSDPLSEPFCVCVDLRPVESFRHTAVIPISEKDLIENKKKIDERNRKGYYVEIKKDTIYFYTIALLTLGSIFYTFLMVNEKQVKIKQDL